MTADRNDDVYRIFEQALPLPPAERAAFLDRVCGNDAGLRSEVESLLAHDQQAADQFLRTGGPEARPPGADEALTAAADAVDAAGTPTPLKATSHRPQIDGYEITRELNRGGQGAVYQAVQTSTKRKVAIKVLLEGHYASPSVRKRFEREVELLASPVASEKGPPPSISSNSDPPTKLIDPISVPSLFVSNRRGVRARPNAFARREAVVRQVLAIDRWLQTQ